MRLSSRMRNMIIIRPVRLHTACRMLSRVYCVGRDSLTHTYTHTNSFSFFVYFYSSALLIKYLPAFSYGIFLQRISSLPHSLCGLANALKASARCLNKSHLMWPLTAGVQVCVQVCTGVSVCRAVLLQQVSCS